MKHPPSKLGTERSWVPVLVVPYLERQGGDLSLPLPPCLSKKRRDEGGAPRFCNFKVQPAEGGRSHCSRQNSNRVLLSCGGAGVTGRGENCASRGRSRSGRDRHQLYVAESAGDISHRRTVEHPALARQGPDICLQQIADGLKIAAQKVG